MSHTHWRPDSSVPSVYKSASVAEQVAADAHFVPSVNYLRLLWTRKWFVIGGMLIGGALGTFWVISKTPRFQGKATIELLGFNESFMGMNQLDPQAGTGNYGANAANIQTQIRILMSISLRNKVAERVALELPPMSPAPGNLFDRLRSRLQLVETEPVKVLNEAVAEATGSTVARGVGLSRLIEISCQSRSPQVASAFLNTLAAEFVSQSSQARSNTSIRTMQWMEGQLEETRNRLQQAETKLQEFIKKEGLPFVLDQNTLADSKLRELQSELSKIQSDRIAKQSRHELAKSSPIDSLPDILDDGTLRGLRERITDLRREKAHLAATLMPGHQKMQRINAQIEELDQAVQREKSNLVRRIQNDYEEALRREKLMLGSYGAQQHSVANQADKAAQLAGLKREAEMAQQAYNSLLLQLNQATMVSAVPAAPARVIDPALTDTTPVAPKPTRDIGSGILVGGLSVYGLLVLSQQRRIQHSKSLLATPGHASSLLDVPELGVIPTFQSDEPESPIRLRWTRTGSLRLKRSANEGADSRAMSVWNNRRSFQSEAFRLTLTSVLRKIEDSNHTVLVLTSAGPDEGKTTIASNLAIGLAESGRRVLLVDCDFRKHRLDRVFQVDNAKGLRELLISEQPVAELLKDGFIHPTAVPGLAVLPSGQSIAGEYGKLLFSRRLPELFRQLREMYDTILLDTPPALHFSDARLLGRVSDGVVFVVRSGITHRQSAVAIRHSFAEDGIPILGLVLNDWDPQQAGHDGQVYQHVYRQYDSEP